MGRGPKVLCAKSGFLDGVAGGSEGRLGKRWMVLKTVVVPQVQFVDGRGFPVVTQRLIPLVQTVLTILEIPQFQCFDKVVVVVVAQKTVEAPQLQCVIPVVTQRLFHMVLTVQQTIAIRQCFDSEV